MNAPVLRSLDVADRELTDDQRVRAAATLERIVLTSPSTEPTRRPRRRLALAGAAASALVVGSVLVVQSIGEGQPAYASWTATPSAVSSHDLDAVATACRQELSGSSLDTGRAKITLAERRGDHVALLLRTDNPDISAACLVHNPAGSGDADQVRTAVGGSSGPSMKAPARSFTLGNISEFDGTHGASVTDGAVGDQVSAMVIHAGTITVHASVQHGRYAAWWPGRAFPAGPYGPSGKGGPEPIMTYDLTLVDGSVIHNAKPSHPA